MPPAIRLAIAIVLSLAAPELLGQAADPNSLALWAMGANDQGQLGDGTTTNRNRPVQVAGGVTAVATGEVHTLFLKADGSLWAVGANDQGQLGDGTTDDRRTPTPVASGVKAVAAGHDAYDEGYSLFVKTDGTLWAMGENKYGGLGDGTTTGRAAPEQVATAVASVAAGGGQSFYIGADGTLWAMGYNVVGQLGDGTTANRSTPVPVAHGAKAAAAGDYFSLFLESDGSLWAMGDNDNGEAGDGTIVTHHAPVQVATGVISVAAGADHSLYVKADGTLWAAGENGSGQLGDGTTSNRGSPVQVATGVAAVAAAGDHSIFLKTDGTVWAMGDNQYGQLGDGTNTNRANPVQVGNRATAVAAGKYTSFFIAARDDNPAAPPMAVQPAGETAVSSGSVAFAAVAGGTQITTYQWQVSTDDGGTWTNLTDGGAGTAFDGTNTGNLTITGTSLLMNGARFRCLVTNATSGARTISGSATLVLTSPLIVSTLAGQTLSPGDADGTGSNARFRYPTGVAADAAGNFYLADTDNNTIRRIPAATGAVTTLAGLAGVAGSADGSGSAARFNGPSGVAVDGAANVYVADTLNHTIRMVTPDGVVTTVAGSPGNGGSADGSDANARFLGPQGLALDGVGNLYVADTNNHTIRKVVLASRDVSTIAGLAGHAGATDGPAGQARFNDPSALAIDGAGNLYVADTENHTIRKITPSGQVMTLAGLAGNAGSMDGTGNGARFDSPSAVTVDSSGVVFVADTGNFTIRAVSPATGTVATLAGLAGTSGSADGTGPAARFFAPAGLAADRDGNLGVADTNNHTVRLGLPPAMPAITGQPLSQTVTAGSTVQLAVRALGRPAPTYQWYFNGAPINGATGGTFSLANVAASAAGDYTVTATNIVGSVTSDAATLTVTVPAAASLPSALPGNASGSASGGGGGGGALNAWFGLVLAAIGSVRWALRARPRTRTARSDRVPPF